MGGGKGGDPIETDRIALLHILIPLAEPLCLAIISAYV